MDGLSALYLPRAYPRKESPLAAKAQRIDYRNHKLHFLPGVATRLAVSTSGAYTN
jgi:hypothetical protein